MQAKAMQFFLAAVYRSPEPFERMLALTCVWLRTQLGQPWAKSS
jgi:hypothetical protein